MFLKSTQDREQRLETGRPDAHEGQGGDPRRKVVAFAGWRLWRWAECGCEGDKGVRDTAGLGLVQMACWGP